MRSGSAMNQFHAVLQASTISSYVSHTAAQSLFCRRDGADGPSRHQCAIVRVRSTCKKEPPTMDITRIGLDTAKSIFQVLGVDETGKAIMKRKLQRSEMFPFPKKHPLGRCQARLVAAQIPGTLPVVEDSSGHAACSDLHSTPHRDRRKTCHAGAYCRREQRSCARWR